MSTVPVRSHRSKQGSSSLVSFSISYEKDPLLRRGLGIEHLRELLLGLARPLLRVGASVAYGGHWRDIPENFTYDLLRLISAEREDNSFADPSTATGRLYNHQPWPYYLNVTPATEAQWVLCCRILRISQTLAGIELDRRSPEDGSGDPGLKMINAAITLSAMRKIASTGMTLVYPDVSESPGFVVPQQTARVVLGGKTSGYGGFIPGIFEEALLAMELGTPLLILGGFGGAARVMADALLAPPGSKPKELELAWQREHTPTLAQLDSLASGRAFPAGVRNTEKALQDLCARIDAARAGSLASALKTGLSEDDTRELMTTVEIRRALQLAIAALQANITGVTLALA
jgi:hypothetical protein